jgi:hypothetical protein
MTEGIRLTIKKKAENNDSEEFGGFVEYNLSDFVGDIPYFL